MPETTPAPQASAERSYPHEIIDLARMSSPDPSSVKPEVVVNREGFKVLRLGLLPGQRMATHDHVGCHVTIQCLAGVGAVELDGTTMEMTPGQLLCFDGESRVSPGNDSGGECALLITLVERCGEQ